MKTIRNLFANNKGATAIEYGLIAALIAVAAITAMGTLADNVFTDEPAVVPEMEQPMAP